MARKKYTEEDFWKLVNKTEGCWEWTGSKLKSGYGRFAGTRAHRYVVTLDGRDPTDLYVCHHCDNPICVRPDHLFLGTNQDNMDDRMRKGRYNIDNTYKRKLTDDQVREIRNSPLSQSKLSKIYGIAQANICRVRTRKTYPNVPDEA